MAKTINHYTNKTMLTNCTFTRTLLFQYRMVLLHAFISVTGGLDKWQHCCRCRWKLLSFMNSHDPWRGF